MVDMGVLTPLADANYDLELLTTRSVHDWRIKLYTLEGLEAVKKWMRRSRLVARDFVHQKRGDVHSPASGHHSLRLVSILFLSVKSMDGMDGEDALIGSLDVKDAFFVDQEKPVRVVTKVGQFRVPCLVSGLVQKLGLITSRCT